MSDDFGDFLQQMGDVIPLKAEPRVALKTPAKSTPGSECRRLSAVSCEQSDDNFLTSSHVPEVGPHDVVEFQREGVQNGVFKKLRRGRYEIEASVDLHNMTVEQARVEVFDFIKQCLAYEVRTVLITHGKGDRNTENPGIIKSCTALWLRQIDEVIAFHSAEPRHGGVGSVYVMLKKSQHKKDDNGRRFDHC